MIDPVRRDSWCTVFGLAALAGAFWFAVYVPAQRNATHIRAEITAAEQAIGQVPLRVAELEMLQNEAQVRRNYLRTAERMMLREFEVHDVIAQVARLAAEARLTVTKLEPQSPIGQETYQVLPFRASFSGEYNGVVSLLRGLEQSERLFTVKEFTLSGDEGRDGNNLRGDVDFSIYVRRAGRSDFDENNASRDERIADMEKE
jgi:Tfp pilus assembly protein PilO